MSGVASIGIAGEHAIHVQATGDASHGTHLADTVFVQVVARLALTTGNTKARAVVATRSSGTITTGLAAAIRRQDISGRASAADGSGRAVGLLACSDALLTAADAVSTRVQVGIAIALKTSSSRRAHQTVVGTLRTTAGAVRKVGGYAAVVEALHDSVVHLALEAVGGTGCARHEVVAQHESLLALVAEEVVPVVIVTAETVRCTGVASAVGNSVEETDGALVVQALRTGASIRAHVAVARTRIAVSVGYSRRVHRDAPRAGDGRRRKAVRTLDAVGRTFGASAIGCVENVSGHAGTRVARRPTTVQGARHAVRRAPVARLPVGLLVGGGALRTRRVSGAVDDARQAVRRTRDAHSSDWMQSVGG